MEQKSVFQSRNFWTAIISVVLGLLASNDVTTGLSAGDFIDGVAGKNAIAILTFIVPALYTPITKLVAKFKAGTWTWEFLKSTNFITQMVSVISIIVTAYFDAITAGFAIAVITNVINLLYHLLLPTPPANAGK